MVGGELGGITGTLYCPIGTGCPASAFVAAPAKAPFTLNFQLASWKLAPTCVQEGQFSQSAIEAGVGLARKDRGDACRIAMARTTMLGQ